MFSWLVNKTVSFRNATDGDYNEFSRWPPYKNIIIYSDLERFIACCEVIESGKNFSDHLPITYALNLVRAAVSEPQGVKHNNVKRAYKDMWLKANLLLYHQLSVLHSNLYTSNTVRDNIKTHADFLLTFVFAIEHY